MRASCLGGRNVNAPLRVRFGRGGDRLGERGGLRAGLRGGERTGDRARADVCRVRIGLRRAGLRRAGLRRGERWGLRDGLRGGERAGLRTGEPRLGGDQDHVGGQGIGSTSDQGCKNSGSTYDI